MLAPLRTNLFGSVVKGGYKVFKKFKLLLLIFCLVTGSVALHNNVDANAEETPQGKTRSTYYTEEKMANARENIETYDWAKQMRDSAVREAEKYLDHGVENLWEMVTPQSLPRSFAVNLELGSPITGKEFFEEYGVYGWEADPLNDPWKLVDPSSGYKFPTNDFKSYYESGLNEHGIFDPKLADEQYLVNELYPEKGEKWGVDDGFGWVDENGDKWTFIAYYNHWELWHGGALISALNSFRDAYLYTGDMRYAHAGIILLDRIADVYPDMDVSEYKDEDGFLNSHGGTGKGKVVGSIWETGAAWNYLAAYDAFFPAMEEADVVDFLSEKAEAYQLDNPKSSVEDIRRNIEDGILREIFPAVKGAQIRGNFGMHQRTLAMAAVVLDEPGTSEEWIDWIFQSGELVSKPDWHLTGGDVLATLVNDVDRDGFGNEASPEYNGYWLNQIQSVADILDGYDRYPEADLFDNVKFRKMFGTRYPLMMVGKYTPAIGDSGATGSPGLMGSVQEHVLAFEKFRSPVFAQAAYYLNGNSTQGIHGGIFSSDPEKVAEDIQRVIDSEGPLNLSSTNLTGYGFTALRQGESVNEDYGLTYHFPALSIVEASVAHKIFENSGTVQLEANEPGHHITFAFDVPKTDTYEIDLKPFRAQSYGRYEIKIDGRTVGDFDFCGSSGAGDYEKLTTMELAEGTHEIAFENTGKDERATNYKMGVIQLALLDEEAQRLRDRASLGDTQRDLWMYYGRNTGHGHKDTLNIGLHAYGLDLSPDLGYPEATGAHPKRLQWTSNTVSHNTVVVDKSKQKDSWVGIPHHYEGDGKVQLIDVEAPNVYPQTELYRRTTALIEVDEVNSYAVDFFRVKGGNDHHFSFHGAEGTVSTEGLNLVEQPTGTYAGPDVEFGEKEPDQPDGWDYAGSGFHYLRNVSRDKNPSDMFSVDWDIEDTWSVLPQDENIHLRLTMMGEFQEVALADGEPPQKPGSPERLTYVMAHRNGENLESQFVSVIEPYKNERYIESIQPVTLGVNGKAVSTEEAAAVKVELENGRTDYVVSSLNPNVTYTVDGTFSFKGFFGVYSEKDGEPVYGYLHDGTVLAKGRQSIIRVPKGHLKGRVLDFTREMNLENTLTVRIEGRPSDIEDLIGRHIYVENDGERNAVYEIKGIEKGKGNVYTLDIGNATLIRAYVDDRDFSKGYTYDINPGAKFKIPLSKSTY